MEVAPAEISYITQDEEVFDEPPTASRPYNYFNIVNITDALFYLVFRSGLNDLRRGDDEVGILKCAVSKSWDALNGRIARKKHLDGKQGAFWDAFIDKLEMLEALKVGIDDYDIPKLLAYLTLAQQLANSAITGAAIIRGRDLERRRKGAYSMFVANAALALYPAGHVADKHGHPNANDKLRKTAKISGYAANALGWTATIDYAHQVFGKQKPSDSQTEILPENLE